MCHSGIRYGAPLALAVALGAVVPAPADAQDKPDNWLMRIARGAAAAAIEADMGDAQPIDLESAGLVPVPYAGAVVFGISGMELKEGVGLRLKAYLYNPSEEVVPVPIPVITSFVLVDELGRRLEVAAMAVERLEKKAKQLEVPALERLGIELLFLPPPPNAQTGILKIASAGIVRGIPLTTSGAAVAAHASGAADHPPPYAAPPTAAVPPHAPSPAVSEGSHPLLGSWSRGTIAGHIAGVVTGPGGAYSDGFLYTFYPDGTYEFSGIMEAAGAGRVFLYAGGQYRLEGSRLTLAREGGTFLNQTTGSERQLEPETKQYQWRIESDPYDGRSVLKLLVPGMAEDIFYRREN